MKKSNSQGLDLGFLKRHFFPILVWVLVVIAIVGLFKRRTQKFQVIGIAQSHSAPVSAAVTGTITSFTKELYAEVKKGEPLVYLDDSQIATEIKTVDAAIARLKAEQAAALDDLGTDEQEAIADWESSKRRYEIDAEAARIKTIEINVILETDRMTLEDLKLEIEIIKSLLSEEAIAPYELQKAELAYDILAKKVEANVKLLEQADMDQKNAEERLDTFMKTKPAITPTGSTVEMYTKMIQEEERKKDELKNQQHLMVLRAPFDGVISDVFYQSSDMLNPINAIEVGDTVIAGTPILTVSKAKPTEVIGYTSEFNTDAIEVGTQVKLIKQSRPQQIMLAKVSQVGPVVNPLPLRFLMNPQMPQWGRPFEIDIADAAELKLLPGEKVGIALVK